MSAVVKKKGRPTVTSSVLTENEEKALSLREAGASYREIAKALGFKSPDSALQAVKRGLGKTKFESATDALLMDLSNLDDWAKRATHRLRTTGDLAQIDRLMRIMEKRHQLLGVDSTTLAEKMGKKTTAGGATIVVSPSEVGFIQGLMATVGVDPSSPEAQKFLAGAKSRDAQKELPAAEPPPISTPAAPVAQKAGRKVLKKKRKPVVAEVVAPPHMNREEALEVPATRAPVAEEVIPLAIQGDIYAPGAAPTLRESSI